MHQQGVRLILASTSPRRRMLLEQARIAFEIHAVEVDEGQVHASSPEDLVMARARLKAEATAETFVADKAPGFVLGADTVVVLDGEVLGKPAGEVEARHMLRRLSGRTHRVLTGLAVRPIGFGPTPVPPDLALVDQDEARRRDEGGTLVSYEMTKVRMGTLTPQIVDTYVATGEPLDKAGAYGIQERGGLLVEGIAGDYFNIVGLPLGRLRKMLAAFGMELLQP